MVHSLGNAKTPSQEIAVFSILFEADKSHSHFDPLEVNIFKLKFGDYFSVINNHRHVSLRPSGNKVRGFGGVSGLGFIGIGGNFK